MKGTLKEKEPHPATESALNYYNSLKLKDLFMWQESFSSCAIEGNRLAEICSETLDRLMNNNPVSDRYFLGLVWTMRSGDIKRRNKWSSKRAIG
jgi:S-adenosylmethionine:diacylglycerol 3-amino-3-carboxypropyl transferase